MDVYKPPVQHLETYKKLVEAKVEPQKIFEIMEGLKSSIPMRLAYQPYIMQPPVTTEQMWGNATKSDNITVNTWRHTWLENIRSNTEKYGPFKDKSILKCFDTNKYKPCIIAGSGPSLKKNADQLNDRGDIPLVSCLHNFGFFEDIGVKPEYYMTLDAGKITIGETVEGSGQNRDDVYAKTKGHKLLAYIGTDPVLLDKWQGEIIFYNAPVPDAKFIETVFEVINEPEFTGVYLSTGGNALGACMYFSKAILGSGPTIFVGADFSFSYDSRFHSWDTWYDSGGGRMLATDVFGNKVETWASYFNFKNFFDYISIKVPGEYINATEGGILGAYPSGNIITIKQLFLRDALTRYNLNKAIKDGLFNPRQDENGNWVTTLLY